MTTGEEEVRMRLALIGFGEVGSHFGRFLAGQGVEVTAYCRRRQEVAARARESGVRLCETLGETVAAAGIVLSCVWPGSALAVAEAVAPHLGSGQVYGDLNSIGPRTTQQVEAAVASSGVGFAKLVIMANVSALGAQVPILAGGPAAAGLAEQLNDWQMRVRFIGDDPRRPAVFKIVRSYGLKAILAASWEMVRTARRYGIDEDIFTSAGEMLEWPGYGAQMSAWIVGTSLHAERRAQEMNEVMEVIEDAGLDSQFARATRAVFESIAASGVRARFERERASSYREVLDAVEGQDTV